jgi:hypothetical protein
MIAKVLPVLALPLFTYVAIVTSAHVDDPVRSPDADSVVERFAVAKGGDGLLLPVTVQGKKYHFILDTASTLNMFDSSFSLGRPKESVDLKTTGRTARLQLFDAPDASLGGLSLRTDELVGALDLERLRQASGYDIRGVIGMRFLRQWVVRCDFDRGEVLFLRSAGRDSGLALALSFEDNLAYVLASLPGRRKEFFVLDTGGVGNYAAEVGSRLFDALANDGVLKVSGKVMHESAGGTTTQRLGRVEDLTLGEFTVTNAIVGESTGNQLGLGFLSRFVVTFDFPRNTVYLKRGKLFGIPHSRDRSGLHILRRKDRSVVDSVDKDSPAAVAGFLAGDIVTRVDDVMADGLSLFELRKMFNGEPKTRRVLVRRGDNEMELAIVLEERAAPKK